MEIDGDGMRRVDGDGGETAELLRAEGINMQLVGGAAVPLGNEPTGEAGRGDVGGAEIDEGRERVLILGDEEEGQAGEKDAATGDAGDEKDFFGIETEPRQRSDGLGWFAGLDGF